MPTSKNEEAKNPMILVIEDEPGLADIYTTKLKMSGFDVMNSFDGVDGLETALRERPALIMLDLILPLKDGFEVLRDLKQNPATRDIPVIIMSNLGQDFEVKRGLALGADQYLIKTSIDPTGLAETARQVLDRSRRKDA